MPELIHRTRGGRGRHLGLIAGLVVTAGLASNAMAAPCNPADCNGDGSLTVSDFFCFVAAFAAGDPAADCDGSGAINVNDFFCFVSFFSAGCPSEPIDTDLAGDVLPGYPFFNFVRAFNTGTSIHIAVDPTIHPSIAGVTGDIYIVNAKTDAQWSADSSLTDVRGAPQTHTFAGGTIQANTVTLTGSSTIPADAGLSIGVPYDFVIDVDQDGTLSTGDFVDRGNAGNTSEAGGYTLNDLTALGPLATAPFADYAIINDPLIVSSRRRERVVWPADIATRGQVPLIVISHGNGQDYRWYDYIQQHFASRGYIVMSHQNNTVPGIETSSETTLRHTDAFLDELSIHLPQLVGHIDTSRITWIGHSRGGEGVARAYDRLFDFDFIPNHYSRSDIVLVSSIAPTDFLGTSRSNPHDANYHLIYGSADGDVCGCPNNNIAQSFLVYERAIGNRQVTYVHGADHNDFNCCGFNDFTGPPGTEIGRAEAQQVAKGAWLALVERYVEGNIPAIDVLTRQYETFKPIGVNPATIVVSEYRDEMPGTTAIDNYQALSGTGASSSGGLVTFNVTNLTEARMDDNNTSFTWLTSDPMNGMTRTRPSDIEKGVVFDYNGASFFYDEAIIPPMQDFTQWKYLSFRATQGTRHPDTVAINGDLTFTVRLTDGSGVTSSINIGVYGGGVEQTYPRTGFGTGAGWQNEFETTTIRLSDFTRNGSGIDLTDITNVRFEFGSNFGTARGRVALDDIELTNLK